VKKQTLLSLVASISRLPSAAALLLAASPIAQAAAPSADLSVSVSAPSIEAVNTANRYTVRVSNIGRKDASASVLKVTFPLTNTSPQRFLLGQLSQLAPGCSLSLDTLTCNIAPIAKNNFREIAFTYSMPVTSTVVQLVAVASTNDRELSLINNRRVHQAVPSYPSLAIAADSTATNSHCSGTDLSAYFECELFPSSISSHAAVFHAGGILSIPEAPDYTGAWQQAASNRLTFQYFDSNSLRILSFEGFGSVPGCFDGITRFDDNQTYVSAYRVCF
jgi:hypothetical protein